ncbi:MAG: SGNH/GDSL hydrolase family protein [Lachnospiraceae bacterium]|nr:SGNH/GDSL hydrolase family protein [Lachnospiraceae bacterium]
MIYDKIDFHNVEELEETEKGLKIWRLPKELREKLNDGIKNDTASLCSGVELRFCLKGESAKIKLRVEDNVEAATAFIYYGSFQGGWMSSQKQIRDDQVTEIIIEKSDRLSDLKRITKEQNLPFDPEVVRIVMPYNHCYYCGIEGDIETPLKSQYPEKTYLAYGSSITHGSLSLGTPHAYVFRISQMLKCDYINLGFAGTAQLEKEIAEYICNRKDWDFASVELGVNMLDDQFSCDFFEERAKNFVEIMSKDPRKVFATSIFGFSEVDQAKADKFREIAKKYSENKLIFTEGKEILDNPAYIAADLIHPSIEGAEQIASRWGSIIEKGLNS